MACLVLLLLAGCAVFSKFEQPEASLADVKFEEVGLRNSRIRLFIRVKNNNPFDITLSPVQTLVWVGEEQPVIEIDRQTYTLVRESETIIEVPIELNYRRILGAIPIALKTELFRYQFKGTAHVGIFTYGFDFLGNYPDGAERAPAAEVAPIDARDVVPQSGDPVVPLP